MSPWTILGAVVFGAVFAFFAFLRLDVLDPQGLRVLISVFLFGFYCAVVIFGTSEKKRTVSVPEQTLLGVLVACAIAALFHTTPTGYAAAVIIGLLLGFTADFWVKHVQLP